MMESDNPYATTPTGLGHERPAVPFGPPPWPEQGGIPFEGQLSYEDFLDAQRLHAGWRGHPRVRVLLLVLAAAPIILSLRNPWRFNPISPVLALSLLVPVLIVVLIVARRLSYRRLWSASKLNGQPLIGHVSEAGVELRLPILEARMTWQAYVKYRTGPELLLLYQQPASFNLFPRRLFRDEADWRAALDLVETHLPRG